MTRRILAAVFAVTALLAAAPPASADTEGCMSRNEYDHLQWGMTRIQVYDLFDIYGTYIGDSGNNGEYRVGYRSCWAPGERRGVLGFSYNTSGLEWWDIRDV
jgi:hypothetical protein